MNGLRNQKAFQDFDQMSIASYASIDNVQSNDKKSNSRDIKIVLFTIILGQLLSIISTVTHYLSFNLLFINNKIPSIFFSVFYFLFGMVWLIINKFKIPKFKSYYLLLLVLDSQSCYLKIISLSYKLYQNIFIYYFSSSFFSFIFKMLIIKKYQLAFYQYFAVLVNIIGSIILLIGIFIKSDSIFSYLVEPNVFVLILLILSSILNSLSTTLQDNFFRSGGDIYDYFSFSSPIISVILFIESFIFGEYKEFMIDNVFTLKQILYLLCFIICSFIVFSLSPFFIKHNTAIMYNFTLNCNVFYLYCIGIMFLNQTQDTLYYYIVGFCLNIFGLVLYGKYKCLKVTQLENEPLFKIETNLSGKENNLFPEDSDINNGEELEFGEHDKRNSLYRARSYSKKYIQ